MLQGICNISSAQTLYLVAQQILTIHTLIIYLYMYMYLELNKSYEILLQRLNILGNIVTKYAYGLYTCMQTFQQLYSLTF